MGMVVVVGMGLFCLVLHHRLLDWMDRRGDLLGSSGLRDFLRCWRW